MAERPVAPDDNPFRQNSPRNVLARARERLELVKIWLIRHDPPTSKGPEPPANGEDRKKV